MLSVAGCDQQVKGRNVSIVVPSEHPLLKLASLIPWEELAKIVLPDLKSTTAKGMWNRGRKLHVRTHLGAYILQKIAGKTDREIGQDLQFNAVFRIFAGEGIISNWRPPHFSKIEEFRNRLSPDTQLKITNLYAKVAVEHGFADPTKVDIDSTVQEANMTYPSDAKLMTQVVERCVKVISWIKEKTRNIVPSDFKVDLKKVKTKAKSYFFLAKNTAKEVKQECFADLHKAAKQEAYACLEHLSSLSIKQIEKMPWNIRRSYDQITNHAKRYLLDVAHFIRNHKIKPGKRLSLHLEEVACIVKGKAGKPHEFGRVIQIGRLSGNFVWTTSHTSVRMDDKSALPAMMEEHQNIFGKVQIGSCATDRGYYSQTNEEAVLKVLSDYGSMHLGYQYEDTDDETDTKLRDHRAGIEAVIGHIKNGGQLGQSRMKSDEATLAAGYAAMGAFNLRQLMRCQAGL